MKKLKITSVKNSNTIKTKISRATNKDILSCFLELPQKNDNKKIAQGQLSQTTRRQPFIKLKSNKYFHNLHTQLEKRLKAGVPMSSPLFSIKKETSIKFTTYRSGFFLFRIVLAYLVFSMVCQQQ